MAQTYAISIIIPVYNAEKYLERCVESVVRSLGKIRGEILIVDNNSADKSCEIIDSLKKQLKDRMVILRCNTPGASSSRNLGARHARGEYLWFIDADDTIAPDAISRLLQKARKEKADLVMLGANRVYQDGHKDYLSAINKKNYKSRFVRYGMGPWQVLIRRNWWRDNDLEFKEGIIHEDMELMSVLALYTDNFSSINEPLYNYYENQDSVLHKGKFNSHIFDIFPALEGLYQRFVDKKAEKKFHAELEWFFIWNLLIDSAKDFARFKEGKPGFTRSRKMLKQYFPAWRHNKFLKQKSLKLRILVRINYYK